MSKQITYADVDGVARATMGIIPTLIGERRPFDTDGHRMSAFTDVNGVYHVLSYQRPAAEVLPDGTVKFAKHVFTNHREAIERGVAHGRV